MHQGKIMPGNIIKTALPCCALCQLSSLNNFTSSVDIKKTLDILRKEKVLNKEVGISTGNGQTAVFTIVSPGEEVLEARLKKLGFTQAHTFDRRKGYPFAGILKLKMYVKNL